MALPQMIDQLVAGAFEGNREIFEGFEFIQVRRSRQIVDILDAHQPGSEDFTELSKGQGRILQVKRLKGLIHTSLAIEVICQDG